MRKTFRLLALALAVLMIVPLIFAGCTKDDGKKPDATTPAPAQTTTAPSTQGTKMTEPTDDPNKIDLDGYEFRLGTTWHDGLSTVGNSTEGTALYDELMDIYAEIESELNCTIVAEGNTVESADLIAAAVGGTKLGDFITQKQNVWIPLAMMNGIRPLDEMVDAGLDLYNDNVFNQYFTQITNLNGHTWALDVIGKFSGAPLGHFYAFNKELTESVGYPAETIYQAVRDGKWNYAMMLEIAGKITRDSDNDGNYDIYGIALDTDGNEVWTNGTGPIVYKDGKWVANLTDPQLMPALDFMYALSQPEMTIPVIGDTASRGQRRTNFYEGRAGFAGLYGGDFGNTQLLEMAGNGKFGAVPIPKGPNADHYIMNYVDVSYFVCQTANTDWEKSAKVMNALGARLTDWDAYKDAMLQKMNDEEAIEMIFDYAVPNGMLNVAKCSDEMYQLTRKGFYKAIYELALTPAAAAEAYQDKVQAELDNVFQQK